LYSKYARDIYACAVDLGRKAYQRVRLERVCGVLREHGLFPAAFYRPSSFCKPAQTFLSVLAELITTVHCECSTPTRACAVTTAWIR